MCREIGKEKILNRSGNLMSKLSHRYLDRGDKICREVRKERNEREAKQ